MIEKVIKKGNLKECSEIKENLLYWLSKTPEERVAAVEELRKQLPGSSERIKKIARLIDRRMKRIVFEQVL